MNDQAETLSNSLATVLREPYAAYAYSYPHKTAYRRLEPPVPLREAWREEDKSALFAYLHVPFCEMRCGFCNLFTTVERDESAPSKYLDALERQVRRVREQIEPQAFARMAIGGGTPTFLNPDELHRLFDISQLLGTDPRAIPVSVETSPQTATPERLKVLWECGATRVSIGVQSWIEEEVHGVGRAQKTSRVEESIQRIRETNFPILNIDLMYGLPGQTRRSWLHSLNCALKFAPEEIYLYPLYVRPLTGLGRRNSDLQREGDARLEFYRTGREKLLSAGYRQVSMRMFQLESAASMEAPVYCCQQDGMIGAGCGARSYTSALHYSSEYAVGAPGVREILSDYISRPDEAFDVADYGFRLNAHEQRRRYLIQSVLQIDGLDFAAYQTRFGSAACDDVPELDELLQLELAEIGDGVLRLNAAGFERSDAIGPWLASSVVRSQMQEFALR